MAKNIMRFFTRSTWNKIDILWFIVLLLLSMWVFYPSIIRHISPIEKQEVIINDETLF